ncbi:hypothetical protein JXA56_02660 [Candidatus Micrarchaeota archaeon]|nr:hypothetical protein [Candidatus Micrarchaeota archaeon]
MKMQPRTREQVNEFLGKTFADSPLTPGPVERIFFNYLKNWLGRKIDDSERRKIREVAKESYDCEWQKSGCDTHTYIKEAERRIGLIGNEGMNQKLAMMVVPFIINMLNKRRENRKIRIFEIGSGSGDTAYSILYAMRMECLEAIKHCHLITLEPAYAKVEEEDLIDSSDTKGPRKESNIAVMAAKLRQLPHEFRPKWTPVGDVFESYMASVTPGCFDIIVSGSAMHHIPDPRYWYILRDKIAEDGVIVFADWFTKIFSHPGLLVPTLRDLEISEAKIRKYEDFFGLEMNEYLAIEKGFIPEQVKSLEQMRSYIKHLSDELKLAGKARMQRDSELLLFEGHHSHDETIRAAEEAGFSANKNDIICHANVSPTIHTRYNVNQGSDISTVFALVPRKRKSRRPLPMPKQQVLKI